jgi:hypothetical protein
MIHKISDLCKKIDGLKVISDRLYNTKYGPVKAPKQEVDHLIQTIQADCLLVSADKNKYDK